LEVARISDHWIPAKGGKIRLRMYLPESLAPLPLLAYFHGGGFVLGSLEETNAFCTRLAAGAHCAVASVDYRLAPEHRWPTAEQDALAAVTWLAENAPHYGIDASRFVIAGNSAGANLAAHVALRLRERAWSRLGGQVLICPWLDLMHTNTESFHWFGQGDWLSATTVNWFRFHYFGDFDDCTRASPLLEEDPHVLPPALIVAAEFDVLRSQAESFADRLSASGNDMDMEIFPGVLHDFVLLPGQFARAVPATVKIIENLRKTFARRSV